MATIDRNTSSRTRRATRLGAPGAGMPLRWGRPGDATAWALRAPTCASPRVRGSSSGIASCATVTTRGAHFGRGADGSQRRASRPRDARVRRGAAALFAAVMLVVSGPPAPAVANEFFIEFIAQRKAPSVTRAQAAEIARSRAGGGTVLNIRTRGNNGGARHFVRILNPKGQVVVITVDGGGRK